MSKKENPTPMEEQETPVTGEAAEVEETPVEAAAETCDVVVLAQGSMTVLLPLLGHIQKPVLTSPRLGVERVKEVLGI